MMLEMALIHQDCKMPLCSTVSQTYRLAKMMTPLFLRHPEKVNNLLYLRVI